MLVYQRVGNPFICHDCILGGGFFIEGISKSVATTLSPKMMVQWQMSGYLKRYI